MRRMKSRRGSTLVLVALMLVALTGVTAIAADIGRFYVVTGELQTGADAAALKGAAVLQRLTANYASSVDDSVMLWARTTNRSDGDSLVIPATDIDVGWWEPSTRTFSTAVPAGQRPNAVSVKASGSPRGVFAQMIGRTAGLPLQRSAVAWIANISSSCTRPWALPYLPLVLRVNGNTDTTKDLDMGKFTAYANTSAANRTMIIQSVLNQGTQPVDGNWTAFNLPSGPNGGANSGQTTFQSQIASCNNIAVNSNAANGNIQPSNGQGPCQNGTVVCWTTQAITGMNQGQINGPGVCTLRASPDATCYTPSGVAGVTTDITYANVTGNGSGAIDFKYVGQTTVACYIRTPADICNAIPDPRLKSGYPEGTFVVISEGLKSPILNPSLDILSNSPSNRQRLLLVQ